MTRTAAPAPARPELRDAVVIDGTKYRIKAIAGGQAELRQSFGPAAVTVPLGALAYDRIADVWRAPRVGPWARNDAPTSPDRYTPEPTSAPAEDAPPLTPTGTCSDHPQVELVTRRQYRGAGGRSWSRQGEQERIVCPDPGHGPGSTWGYRGLEPPLEALRCAWCGERLYPHDPDRPSYKRASTRRAYCTMQHRVRAFRERQAEAEAAKAWPRR